MVFAGICPVKSKELCRRFKKLKEDSRMTNFRKCRICFTDNSVETLVFRK